MGQIEYVSIDKFEWDLNQTWNLLYVTPPHDSPDSWRNLTWKTELCQDCTSFRPPTAIAPTQSHALYREEKARRPRWRLQWNVMSFKFKFYCDSDYYRNLWPISYRVVKLNLKLSCFEPISCDTSNGWGMISRYGIVALNISIAGQDLLNFKQPQIRFRTLPYIFLPAKSIYEWHCCPTEASKIILIHSHLLITLLMEPAKIPQCAPSTILKMGVQ